MDGIKEMLDRLSDLSEGELADLESKIIDEFGTVEKQEPTAQVVDSMTALADALDAVRGEQTSRVTAQKELETRAAEAASRVRQVKPGEEEVDPNADPSATDAPPVDAAPPAEAPPPADAPPDEAETPAEDAVPGEETEEEKKKKKDAVPTGTFSEASTPTPENEPSAPDNDAAPPENEPTGPSNTPGTPENEPTAVVTSEATPVGVPAVPTEVSTNPPVQNEEIPVAASASDVVVTPPAENRPVPRQSASVAITAGADIPGISAGTELSDASQVTNAFIKRLHNLQRVSSPNGQQYTVATLTASYPEDRILYGGDTEGNWDKIQKVAGVEAITAAAGACIPLEIRYDIDGIGSTDTPVQDSLPRFTADRGGIRFYPSPLLPEADYDGAIGVWDPLGDPDANVTDLDGGNPRGEKPCLPVQCLPFEEAVLEAVSVCMCFDNLTGRVFPELIAAHNKLALVQHARSTEQFFLSKLKLGATETITATQTLGAAREILGQVDKVTSVLRYRNRISPTQSFR
ncbi:MAG TPA: major capsid protein, partial [Actinomycetes bacterium]|nr:major capsid protein [Actinomycetes bacterium]